MKTTLLFTQFCLLVFAGFSQITPFKFEDFSQKNKPLVPANLLERNEINNFNEIIESMKDDDLKRLSGDTTLTKKKQEKKKTAIDEKYSNVYYYNSKLLDTLYHSMLKKIDDKYDTLRDLEYLSVNDNEDDVAANMQKLRDLESARDAEINNARKLLEMSQEYAYHYRVSDGLAILPSRNSTDAQLFYNNVKTDKKAQFGESTTFVYNTQGNKISGTNELYADYFGGFRLSFGVLVSNQTQRIISDSLGNPVIDSSGIQVDAVQRLLGGGGNGIFTLSCPLLYFKGPQDHFGVKLMLSPKFSFDVPALGKTATGATSNTDVGVDLATYYAGAANVMTLYAYDHLGMVAGTTNFYNNLNIDQRKPFLMNQLTFGIAFNSHFKVSYTLYAGNDFVRKNFQSMISFAIITD